MAGLFASVAGQRVVKASAIIPYYGTWVADVELAGTFTLPTNATLTLADLALVGVVARQYAFGGVTSARLIGGFGGWRKTIAAKAYSAPAPGIPLGMVLRDAAAESGEKINTASVQSAFIGLQYVRESAPAERVLRQLAGALWWVDPTGTTQIVARLGTSIASQFTAETYDGATGKAKIATETLSDWMPGRTFKAPTLPTVLTVGLVTHSVGNDGKLRTEVLTAP